MSRYRHTLLALIFAGSTSVYAEDSEIQSTVSMLEMQTHEATVRTVHGNYGGKTATAAPIFHGENWFFIGEMLHWHAQEGGTDYAQLFEATPGTAASNKVKNRTLNFKWDYGFRAGIGTTFNHDRWDMILKFTWFRTDNSSVTSLHGNAFISPLAFAPSLPSSWVKSHWKIHFYDFDLTLGRPLFLSPSIAFRPYVGAKSAFISQTRRSQALVVATSDLFKAKDRNDFWGIGPGFGVEGKWFLVSAFHVFGSAGGGVLWGDFDVRHQESDATLGLKKYRFNLDTHQIVPMAEFQLGLGYETNIHHDQYHIGAGVRYEYQYWWNQNQMPLFSSSATLRYQRAAEDLSLQGITVDVRFDF